MINPSGDNSNLNCEQLNKLLLSLQMLYTTAESNPNHIAVNGAGVTYSLLQITNMINRIKALLLRKDCPPSCCGINPTGSGSTTCSNGNNGMGSATNTASTSGINIGSGTSSTTSGVGLGGVNTSGYGKGFNGIPTLVAGANSPNGGFGHTIPIFDHIAQEIQILFNPTTVTNSPNGSSRMEGKPATNCTIGVDGSKENYKNVTSTVPIMTSRTAFKRKPFMDWILGK